MDSDAQSEQKPESLVAPPVPRRVLPDQDLERLRDIWRRAAAGKKPNLKQIRNAVLCEAVRMMASPNRHERAKGMKSAEGILRSIDPGPPKMNAEKREARENAPALRLPGRSRIAARNGRSARDESSEQASAEGVGVPEEQMPRLMRPPDPARESGAANPFSVESRAADPLRPSA